MTKAKEIMRPQTITLTPRETLAQAAEKMREHEVGVLVVVAGNQVVGIITDRDIVVRCVARGRDPKVTKVEEAMSSPVVHCMEDDSLDNIAEKLSEEHIHRLPVLDRHMALCGLVSVRNICMVNKEKGGKVVSQIR